MFFTISNATYILHASLFVSKDRHRPNIQGVLIEPNETGGEPYVSAHEVEDNIREEVPAVVTFLGKIKSGHYGPYEYPDGEG